MALAISIIRLHLFQKAVVKLSDLHRHNLNLSLARRVGDCSQQRASRQSKLRWSHYSSLRRPLLHAPRAQEWLSIMTTHQRGQSRGSQ
eukprot:5693666-Amphidinium_carterae.1